MKYWEMFEQFLLWTSPKTMNEEGVSTIEVIGYINSEVDRFLYDTIV